MEPNNIIQVSTKPKMERSYFKTCEGKQSRGEKILARKKSG